MLFPDFQPLAAITTTFAGIQRLQPLWETGAVQLWVPQNLMGSSESSKLQVPCLQVYPDSLRETLTQQWPSYQGFIFDLATGAVVRLIAPLLQDKATDPAVVVVGEGQVISLCGGHQGGADTLTRAIALHLNAIPVLTGSANEQALPGIDVLGVPFGWQRGSGNWTGVSAVLARRQPVEVLQEAGCTLWQKSLPADHSLQLGFADFPPAASAPPASLPQARIWISPIQRSFAETADFPKVQWHPRVLWVGIGCERGTSRTLIEAAVQQICRAYHLAEAAIAGMATIDLKADEVGILELCAARQWPLRCFSAAELSHVPVPTPSAVVESEVGTPSVAEAAAVLASLPSSAPLSSAPLSGDPLSTANLADALPLRVAKQIIRQPDQPGAVTIAIAEAVQEYTGRTGQLWLVGIGPGQLTQITPAAQTAINQADAVIGYGLYVDLIRPLLRPGQIVEALPITQERQRAERAIELARWGLTVAVISSGDCGIYGMAGLVMEQLQQSGWDGQTPAVEVFPGITALQAAAARVGTPLMHDFCAISLSDLLTPWPVIEQRLTAAAQADFVTALYNPRSLTRTQQIETAQAIFAQHRAPETPVAIVRSVYRPDEQLYLTTLKNMLEIPIDMLTVVLIGNRSTREFAHWMITPRGYLSAPISET